MPMMILKKQPKLKPNSKSDQLYAEQTRTREYINKRIFQRKKEPVNNEIPIQIRVLEFPNVWNHNTETESAADIYVYTRSLKT